MKEFKDIKIAVAGTGYVGLSIATLLAQHHHVTAVDVVPEKVEKLNKRISPIQDEYIEKYLAEKPLDLVATLDGKAAYKDADFVVIAAPTNYDPVKNYFDTTHVEEVIDLVLEVNPDAVMVIKSTIPVGYTRNLYLKYAAKGVKQFNLLFSPEFLRESKALYDNLYPSRIIVGYPKLIDGEGYAEENKVISTVTDVERMKEAAKTFAALLHLVSPMLVFFILAMPVLLPLLYSGKFLPVLPMMQVAALAMYARAIFLPIEYIALSRGDSKRFLCIELVSDVLLLTMAILGYSRCGLLGMGVGMTIASVLEVFVAVGFCRVAYGYKLSMAQLKIIFVHATIGVLTSLLSFVDNVWVYVSVGALLFVLDLAYTLSIMRRHVDIDIVNRIKRKFVRRS